jgi:fatty-acyl-CoA synthase
MFHANAWGLPHAAVMAGASLVLLGADPSPRAVAALLESEHVTLAAAVLAIWAGVLPELERRDISAIRRIVCGGAPAPRALLQAYLELTGVPLGLAWGMTEVSPVGTVRRVKSTLQNVPGQGLADRRTTVGPACPLVELRISDADTGNELPWDGEHRGELQIRGPWIAAAYHRVEPSTESFVKGGWLQTGDVATIDTHGYVRLVDRIKDLVKSGGEWISSVELEDAIMAHLAVREAAVIGVPDQKWGERPMAVVVREEGAELGGQDVHEFLRGRVPTWWIPEVVTFIDELPRTSVGKISKRELRVRYAAAPSESEES